MCVYVVCKFACFVLLFIMKYDCKETSKDSSRVDTKDGCKSSDLLLEFSYLVRRRRRNNWMISEKNDAVRSIIT